MSKSIVAVTLFAAALCSLSAWADAPQQLKSVKVDLPFGDRMFPGGSAADAINNNCLTCHSAGMVLTQPRMSQAAWQAEVDKMRQTYKAPIADEDVPKIVDYLAKLGDPSAPAPR